MTRIGCLIQDWSDVLPTRSVCLRVPVVSPRSYARERSVREPAVAAKRAATPTEGEIE